MHIPAILTHPEIMGPPLERGVRYAHHFVVELISDGKRLWAVASEEGKHVIHQIAHGIDPSAEIPQRKGPTIEEWMAAGYKASGYPPLGYEAVSTPDEIALAIAREAEMEKADLAAKQDALAKQQAIAEGVSASSGTGGEVGPNNSGNGDPNVPQSLDPEGKPATGGDPQPDAGLPPGNKAGEPPVTTVSSATSFDS